MELMLIFVEFKKKKFISLLPELFTLKVIYLLRLNCIGDELYYNTLLSYKQNERLMKFNLIFFLTGLALLNFLICILFS